MLRSPLTAALIAIGAIACAQDAKFDFKAPAAPASRLFDQISKVANTPMVASAAVANDVLVVDVTSVTAAELMAKIAETIHGEWRKEGSGWVLYRGSNFDAADQRAEAAARVKEFKDSLAKVLEIQKKQGTFNESAAKKLADANRELQQQIDNQASGGAIRIKGDFAGLSNQTPVSRAIATLLSKMSDAQIAALTSGRRVVFTLNPTRMQLPLPNGSLQVIRSFVQEAQTYQNVNKRYEQPRNDGNERRVVINGFGSDQTGDGDPSLGVGYAMLSTQPGKAGQMPNVSLIVADPNGKTIGAGMFFLGMNFRSGQNSTPTPPTNEKPIALSDTSKELAKLIGNGFSVGGRVGMKMVAVSLGGGSSAPATFTMSGADGGKTPTLSDDLKARILNPAMYDPLSFAPGEFWTGAAEIKGEDLVAYLPDSSFTPLNQLANGGNITPSALLSFAPKSADLSVQEKDGWLLVSPKSPAASRTETVNRVALGNALKQLDQKGNLNLDQWSTFAAAQSKAPKMQDIDDYYLRFINTPVAEYGLNQFSFNGGWDTLRFYASLSTGQRQTLSQNGRLPIANLSNFQIGLVSEQVFNSFDGPQIRRGGQPGRGPGGPRIMMGDSIETERTYLLPSGITRDGFVNMNLRNNEVAQAQSSQTGGERYFDSGSLAFERLRMERPEMASFMGNTTYDRFRMANQRTISFQFEFTPEVSLTRQLEDDTPGDRPYGAFEQLADRFRRQVEEQLSQLRNSWGKGGGNQIPPPTF
jgi:hypothetical protein